MSRAVPRPVHAVRPARLAQRGLTLIELGIVLAVLGLLAWGAASSLGQQSAARQRQLAQGWALTWRDALRTHALQHRRLPCPDLTGSGWEGDASGLCGSATVGWLPYRSLGLDLPAPDLRAAYAVFRAPSATPADDADLARRIERTGDPVGSTAYEDPFDLIQALNRAASLVGAQPGGVWTAQPHLTGDGGAQGPINCAANPRDNFAYRLILPLQDRDGDGQRLDPPHSSTALCSQAPGSPLRPGQDDLVLAEGFAALSGWLQAQTW